MIEVQIGKTALYVRGHAGFSRHGSDIVCAAASMLAFALAEAVQAANMQKQPVVETACGSFKIAVFAAEEERARAEGMFDTVRAGYALLAQRYPENVRVLSIKCSENSMQEPEGRLLYGQKEENNEKF